MMRFIKHFVNELINILFSVTIAIVVFMLLRNFIVQPFQVEGHSMDLTLANGNQMLLFKRDAIDRFDVIVFPDPNGSGQSYVKRLIGLPGDTIEVKDDILYLNGIATNEPYLEPLKNEFNGTFTENFNLRNTIGIETIPEGFYFVMGDNRPGSGDSRQFGLVPIESVQGTTSIIYYPFEEFKKLPQYYLDTDGQIKIKK